MARTYRLLGRHATVRALPRVMVHTFHHMQRLAIIIHEISNFVQVRQRRLRRQNVLGNWQAHEANCLLLFLWLLDGNGLFCSCLHTHSRLARSHFLGVRLRSHVLGWDKSMNCCACKAYATYRSTVFIPLQGHDAGSSAGNLRSRLLQDRDLGKPILQDGVEGVRR
jgi:hypothetical protein